MLSFNTSAVFQGVLLHVKIYMFQLIVAAESCRLSEHLHPLCSPLWAAGLSFGSVCLSERLKAYREWSSWNVSTLLTVCVCVYTQRWQEKWMTTVIAWHIPASHKALGLLCVCGGRRGGRPALCGWMRDASVVRGSSVWLIQWRWYNIYSWLRGLVVGPVYYQSQVRSGLQECCNTVWMNSIPLRDVWYVLYQGGFPHLFSHVCTTLWRLHEIWIFCFGVFKT